MALSQKHRSSIYQHLSPIIGEEEAEALLSHFPSRDLDEPVTKEFVRAEIAGVRAEIAELRDEFATQFGDVHDKFGEVEARFGQVDAEFGRVRAEIAGCEARLTERLRQQTMWMAGAVTAGMGLAAGIARLIG